VFNSGSENPGTELAGGGPQMASIGDIPRFHQMGALQAVDPPGMGLHATLKLSNLDRAQGWDGMRNRA